MLPLHLLLFVLYTSYLISHVEQHGFYPRLYADNMQVYGSYRPGLLTLLAKSIANNDTNTMR